MRNQLAALGLLAALAAATALPALAQEGELGRVAKRVARYTERLEKKKGTEFWDTVLQLEALGEDAVDPIIKTLEGGKLAPEVRLGLAKALAALEEFEVSIDTFMDLVKGEKIDDEIRIKAAQMLGSYGDEEMQEDLDALLTASYTPRVRIALAKALYIATGSTKGRIQLKALIKSDDIRVQYDAALALAELEDVESARLVLTQLEREPTDRGRLARAYLRADALQKKMEKLMLVGRPVEPQPTKTKSALIEELIEMVQKYYVDGGEKISRERLIALAAKGIALGLDKHSSYWTPEEYKRFIREMSGEYAGIGVYVGYRGGQFTIISPIYSGPAYKAGLRSRDVVLEVDGWPTRGKSMDAIVKRIKGTPETTVRLKVYRRGWEKAREFTVMRRKIAVSSVKHDMLPGDIGYTRLTHFGTNTVEEMNKALESLKTQGMKGLIIDLRDNGGGWMNAAQKIADMFLTEGKLVVYSEGRSKVLAPRRAFHARAKTLLPDIPLVVVVDSGSASASEIVAGALQVHERATLVGTKTYGKGTVQQPMQLEAMKDARLKLTIARYYLPNDKSIDDTGISPDVVVDPKRNAGWKAEELARLWERKALRNYVHERYAANKALFAELAVDDGRDPSRYPEFDKWYGGLDTKATKQDVREWLRDLVREKVADDMGREFAHDLLEDRQLQRAVLEMARKLGVDPATVDAYKPFRDKFGDGKDK